MNDLKKPVWNVIREDINAQRIGIFNVFEHSCFMRDVQILLRNCGTKAEFSDRLLKTVKYYFWGKSQFEVLVHPLIECGTDIGRKIDPAWQLMNNWDIFVDYVWRTMPHKNNQRNSATGNDNESYRAVLPDRRICETRKTQSPEQRGDNCVSSVNL